MAKYLAHIAITLIAIDLIVQPARANDRCDEVRMKSYMEPLQTYLNNPGPDKLAALPTGFYDASNLQNLCHHSIQNILHFMWQEFIVCELDFTELFDLRDNLTEYCKSKGVEFSSKDLDNDACRYTSACVNALDILFFYTTINLRHFVSDRPTKEVICKYAKSNSEKCMEMKPKPCSSKKEQETVETDWAAVDYYCESTENTPSEMIVDPAPTNEFCDDGYKEECIKPLRGYLQNPGPDILDFRFCTAYGNMLYCMYSELLHCELDFAKDSVLYDLHQNLTGYCESKGIDIAWEDGTCQNEQDCLWHLDGFLHYGGKTVFHLDGIPPSEKELVCEYAKTNSKKCMEMQSESCSLSEEVKGSARALWKEMDDYCNPTRDNNSDPFLRIRLEECTAHKRACMKPLQEFLAQPGPRTLAGLTEGDARITGDKEVCKYAYNNELQCFGKKLLYCEFSVSLAQELQTMYQKFTEYCNAHDAKVEESSTKGSCKEHVAMCLASLKEFLYGHNPSVRLHANDTVVEEKELICKYAVTNINTCLLMKEELCTHEVNMAHSELDFKNQRDLKSYCDGPIGRVNTTEEKPEDQPGTSTVQTLPLGNHTETSQDKDQSYHLDVVTKDIKVCIRALQSGWNLQTDALDSLALYKLLQKFQGCTIKAASIIVEGALSKSVDLEQKDFTAKPRGTDDAGTGF